MKSPLILICFLSLFLIQCKNGESTRADNSNQVDESDMSAGWVSLMSLDDWHIYNTDSLNNAWTKEGDVISFDPSSGDRGDLISNSAYGDFELSLEWKIDSCGNSGIMWGVIESQDLHAPYLTGPEMQILDDNCHPDGKIEKHRSGDLYDMIKCSEPAVKSQGEWNLVSIKSVDGYVVFHLNEKKVVEFQMYDESWDTLVATSKFKDWKEFGKHKVGKIALQDHSDRVSFRNMKIKLE